MLKSAVQAKGFPGSTPEGWVGKLTIFVPSGMRHRVIAPPVLARPPPDRAIVEVTNVRPSLANARPKHEPSRRNSRTICRVAAFQSRRVSFVCGESEPG